MKSCDFSRSFITFVTKERSNNARIQVEARCEIFDQQTGKSEDYYLVASCKGEDTYGTGRLFLEPSYDFCMIYSAADFMIIRTHGNAERNNTTVGENRGFFLDVHFHIKLVEAELLPDNKAVAAATLDNRRLNGRTEIVSPNGRYRAIMEFPVKTMNVNDIQWIYQVDTGPILLPDFESEQSEQKRMVERFQLAFVAYNKDDEAYFVILEPTPVLADNPNRPKVSHYSRIVWMDAKNSLLTLR